MCKLVNFAPQKVQLKVCTFTGVRNTFFTFVRDVLCKSVCHIIDVMIFSSNQPQQVRFQSSDRFYCNNLL